jgi:hypothetical protein
MGPGLFTQISQATLDLVTNHMDVFLATGQHLFNVIATILVIWEGLQVALGGAFRGDRFARLILALAIDGALIHFYDRPFPGVGFVKPAEVRHDVGIYRMYQQERVAIEGAGGT